MRRTLSTSRSFRSCGATRPPAKFRPNGAREALDDLAAFRLRRWAHDALALRIWELRQNLTAYDAAYIALAEALGAPLLTRDRRLASAPGIRARVEVALSPRGPHPAFGHLLPGGEGDITAIRR